MFIPFYRDVNPVDVLSVEKRLLQTIDMIVIKKKRIALTKKSNTTDETQKKSLWGVLSSVGSNKNQESNLFNKTNRFRY